jgi:hypothetical protein
MARPRTLGAVRDTRNPVLCLLYALLVAVSALIGMPAPSLANSDEMLVSAQVATRCRVSTPRRVVDHFELKDRTTITRCVVNPPAVVELSPPPNISPTSVAIITVNF